MSMMLRLMVLLSVALFFGCGDKGGTAEGAKGTPGAGAKAGGKGAAKADGNAAQKAPAAAAIDLLAAVPDDAPYVFANTNPMPKDFLDRIGVAMAPGIAKLEAEIAKAEAELGDSPDDKLGKAFIAEIKGNLNRAGMAKMGLDPDFRFVIHGVGVLPVLRMQLKDPAALKAMVARIEKNSGRKAPTAKQGATEYWRFANDGVVVAVAIVDQTLVVSFSPEAATGDALAAVFGKPSGGAAVKARLAKNAKAHGLKAEVSGYVDFAAIARSAMGTGTPLNNTIFAKVLQGALPPLSAACKTDYEALIKTWPGMAFGYTELTGKRAAARYVIEAEAGLAAELAGLRASVPGVDAKVGLANLVAGIDVGKTLAFAKTFVEARKANPYTCENLTSLNQGIAAMSMGLAQPMPPAITGLQGVNVQVKSAEMGANGPGNIKATALLVAKGADELFAMAKGMVPQLMSLDLKPDGKPIALPAGLVPPVVQAPHVALTKDALAISVGQGEEAGLGALVNAKAPGQSPVFFVAYDFKKFMDLTGASQDMPQDELAIVKGFFDMIGKISYSVDFQKSGIVLDQAIDMN